MKENKYDDPVFFEKYSQFPRSVEGLRAAGEWRALERLLPDLAGKRVLDLGCGFGWHCAYAADHGAARVVGCDLSAKMLAEAQQRNPAPIIEYRQVAIEDVVFPSESFDIVLSSLALHYLQDVCELFHRVYGFLAPRGLFVFSVEHPIFTAQGPQDWAYDEAGLPLHWPVDRYFDEGRREAIFLGEPVVKYHRTLTTYVDALLTAGFSITNLVEPKPEPEMLAEVSGMVGELRRPMMLLIAARKG